MQYSLCSASASSLVQSPPAVSITNAQIPLACELTNVETCPMPIKQEIEATINESMAEGLFPLSLSAPIANNQSNQNLVNSGDDEKYIFISYDCNEICHYGIGVKKQEYDDNVVECIEDLEDKKESYQPVKKPRLESTQSKFDSNSAQPDVIQQVSRQATQPNEMNNQDKQFITVCIECSDCSETFAEDLLSEHLKTHSIGPLQCAVKDCRQSFDNTHILGQHIKQAHQQITKWACDKCSKHYTTYKLLSSHTITQHQLGQFLCTFTECTFTGTYRGKMYSHYRLKHKQTLNCQYSDCNFRTSIPALLKSHQRTHFGIKPYRCKWPDCDYSATQRVDTVKHIRRIHFARNSSSVPNGEQLGEPQDYVEVMHDLLG